MDKNNYAPASILLATSDSFLGSELTAMLEKAGQGVMVAEDGIEVVKLANEAKGLRIVLLDSNLPGLNGYQVSRIIRQTGNLDIVIIIMVWFSVQSLEMALTLGCNELVSKPLSAEDLLGVVNKWLQVPVSG
jgi:CheY-like chemotaxis protein